MSLARALYASAALLGVAGVWLRLLRPALPRAQAVELLVPPARKPAAGAPGATTEQGYAAIVAANVFAQTRTPPRVRFTPTGLAGSHAPAPRRRVLKLYGITVGPKGAVALIEADAKIPGAQLYRVGDLVAGARLVAITDSTVTLAQPSGPMVLHLQTAARRKP